MARLEVTKVTEDALLKLLYVAHGAAKDFEPEDEGADDVGSGDVVKPGPEDACNVLARGEEEAVEGRVLVGCGGGIRGGPTGGSRGKEELEAVEVGHEVVVMEGKGARGRTGRNVWVAGIGRRLSE